MRHITKVAVLVTGAVSPAADVLTVPGDHVTVQAAIDAASGGDTVLVGPGTYSEHLDFLGVDVTVTSAAGPAVTTLQGDGTSSVVTFASGEGPNAALEGFTVTGGWSTEGGGIYVLQSSPTIRGNVVTNNHCGDIYLSGSGAGVYVSGGAPLLEDNAIESNVSGSHYGSADGGGVYLDGSAATLRNNRIEDNWANRGGGLYAVSCPTACTIEGNTILGNEANFGGGLSLASSEARVLANVIAENRHPYGRDWGDGGGLYLIGGAPRLECNVIRNNVAFSTGGGVHCRAGASPAIVNNTIFDNSCDFFGSLGGGGIFAGYDCAPVVTNTILWDNWALLGPEIYLATNPYSSSLTISHSDLEGGPAAVFVEPGSSLITGPGLIDQDPRFVNPGGGHDDLHLKHFSPCRDTGDGAVALHSTDFEGDPRSSGAGVDIGADEFHPHLYCTGTFQPGGGIAAKLVAEPGTAPVLLAVGTSLLDPPLPTYWGPLHVAWPWILLVPEPTMPLSGVAVFPATIGPKPAPYDVPMQGLLGYELTGLFVLEVR